jgi:tripartite-type tricarboxylate transporter receptor subunit TctC
MSMFNVRRIVALASACVLALAFANPAASQLISAERVTVVVPYSPGNGLDLLGREFADILQDQLRVPVMVDNRAGAAGLIGTQYAMRAQPDGQTLLFTANPPFVTSPYSLENLPYDPVKSFVPVARVGSVPLVLVTASKWPIRNLDQLKDFVRKNPKAGNYASAGVGSPGQIYGELLNQAAGLQLQEVRYKATGQALTDVIAGNVLVSLVSITAAAPHIKDGALTALAIGSRERLADFKGVPTLAEMLGQKDFQAGVWYGFFAPAGTPTSKVDALVAEIAKAAESKRLHAFMARQYMVPELLKTAEFAQALGRDVATSRKLVEDAKLKAR